MIKSSEIKEFFRNQYFSEYIEKIDFSSYYDKHIGLKRGGGRDRLSPRKYRNRFERESEVIKIKCMYGSYRFSLYNEKLILKGSEKFPRVISILIVRDRFVLSVLNSYLQVRLDIHRRTANSYIKDIQLFIENHKEETLYFFKTDIKAFFDSINHNRLMEFLSDDLDAECMSMKEQLQPPALRPREQFFKPNANGVLQGLSISLIWRKNI